MPRLCLSCYVRSVPPTGRIFKYCHVGHPVRLGPSGEMRKGVNNVEGGLDREKAKVRLTNPPGLYR